VKLHWSHISEGEIDDLLPFFAIGRLSSADMRRVEKALESDPTLRTKLKLVLEEQAVTVKVNEEQGRPSSEATERFLAALEAEPRRSGAGLRRFFFGWMARLPRFPGPRSFTGLGWLGGLAVITQAAVIGALVSGPQGPPEHPGLQFPPEVHEGCVVVAKLASDAKLSNLTAQLEASNATIIDGPRANGLYLVRLHLREGGSDCDGLVSRLAGQKDLVQFVKRTP
jgi:hypothetical protein